MTNKILTIIFVTSSVCFIVLSLLVHAGFFINIDPQLTASVQKIISVFWSEPLSALTLMGSVEVTGTVLLALLLWKFKRNLFPVAIILILFVSPVLIELLGKNFLYHPGPPKQFFRFNFPILFPSHYAQTNYAYPSGHMLRTAFLVILSSVLVIKSWLKRVSKLLVIIVLLSFLCLMAVSRIYLGEHWTSDVLGGIALGLVFGSLASLYLSLYEKSKISE